VGGVLCNTAFGCVFAVSHLLNTLAFLFTRRKGSILGRATHSDEGRRILLRSPVGRAPTVPGERAAEPLINRPFCPDNAILAGFLGSFADAAYQRSCGCHDGDPIPLTRRTVNTPSPTMQSERVVV
jgi:hypothetical protein